MPNTFPASAWISRYSTPTMSYESAVFADCLWQKSFLWFETWRYAFAIFISCCFEYDDVPVCYTPDISKAIGLDYKSDGFYADSKGNICGSPKYFRKAQDILTKRQRGLRHKRKGSKNYEKQKIKIAKAYRHVSNQRKDFCHQQSAKTANSYDIVCVEDLDIKAMAGKGLRQR